MSTTEETIKRDAVNNVAGTGDQSQVPTMNGGVDNTNSVPNHEDSDKKGRDGDGKDGRDHDGKDGRNDDGRDGRDGHDGRDKEGRDGRDGRDNEGRDDRGGRDHDGHKHVDVRPDEDCRGEDGAENFAFHDRGHWRIDGFNGQEGDMLDFSGYGLSRDQIAGQITNIKIEADNFIINFGDDVSITLAGVKPDQIGWDDVKVPGDDGKDGRDGDGKDGRDHDGKDGKDGRDHDGKDGKDGRDHDGKDDHGGKDGHGHKHVDARPGEDCRGEDGTAENFAFHDLGHWKIDGFNGEEGDMLDFTEYGLSRDQIASHITNIKIEADNFIVNFGDDVSITLVGQPPVWENVTTVEG